MPNKIRFNYMVAENCFNIICNKDTLGVIKEMVELKLKLGDNLSETVIFKDIGTNRDINIKFELLDEE